MGVPQESYGQPIVEPQQGPFLSPLKLQALVEGTCVFYLVGIGAFFVSLPGDIDSAYVTSCNSVSQLRDRNIY